jgi:hypothetical protein
MRSNFEGRESFEDVVEDGGLVLLVFVRGVDEGALLAVVGRGVEGEISKLRKDKLHEGSAALLELVQPVSSDSLFSHHPLQVISDVGLELGLVHVGFFVFEPIDEVVNLEDRFFVSSSSFLIFVGASEGISAADVDFNSLGDHHFALNFDDSSFKLRRIFEFVRVGDDFNVLVIEVVVDLHFNNQFNYYTNPLHQLI